MSNQEKPRSGGAYVRSSDGTLTKIKNPGEGEAPKPMPAATLAEPADVQDDEEED
jgi:hypothetical protein